MYGCFVCKYGLNHKIGNCEAVWYNFYQDTCAAYGSYGKQVCSRVWWLMPKVFEVYQFGSNTNRILYLNTK